MRTDARADLLRRVDDDSPWYDKALFHAITALEEIGDHMAVVALFAVENALELQREAACEVCGAGPRGRCDPPDDFDGECPHGCSPER